MKKLLSIVCAFICLVSVSALFCACNDAVHGSDSQGSRDDTIYDYAEHMALLPI